jgi:hypothetical protein
VPAQRRSLPADRTTPFARKKLEGNRTTKPPRLAAASMTEAYFSSSSPFLTQIWKIAFWVPWIRTRTASKEMAQLTDEG